MYKKVTARQGEAICRKLGLDYGMDGRTFYVTDDKETMIFEFDSRKRRDAFLQRHKIYSEMLNQ